ncbi:MAG TPA: SDR family oxidoreductase [Candidatus Limnocylindrales bacterium]|jgi:NAD(P)-dependent dehydrogenase (short-subunit alcohol dehydrogenase family)|nr:SDR family oxidoreductase [Candidatus Limnocylindrales bacterium]
MGRVAVITGASQGIGRATALRLARQPDISGLALVARSEAKLHETRDAIGDGGPEVECYPYDLADLEGIPDLVASIHRRFGTIDALCNIAGYAEPSALLDTTTENVVRTFTINVMAMIVLIREAVRRMQHHSAKILNVASTAGISSRPGWVAYASSKAAVVSLSATLSDELAGRGIKVYSISPGRCATDLRRILAPEEDLSTIMQPEEVADVIARLLDESEAILDGQNIIVRRQI